jgi:exodeoxyribonuclease III
VCGDWNIAHQEIDLKNYKGNKKNSGFLPEERAWMTQLLNDVGWVDVYRKLHPNDTDACYTWWSNRGAAYEKNVGWRIDYQIATPNFAQKATKLVFTSQSVLVTMRRLSLIMHRRLSQRLSGLMCAVDGLGF